MAFLGAAVFTAAPFNYMRNLFIKFFTLYILLISLCSFSQAAETGESFAVFMDEEIVSGELMPVAVQFYQPVKPAKVSVSVTDRDGKLCAFKEGVTDSDGFLSLKIMLPGLSGNYKVDVASGSSKDFLSYTKSVKVVQEIDASLNAVPVFEDGKNFLSVYSYLSEGKDPLRDKQVTLSVFDGSGLIAGKEKYTDANGFVCEKFVLNQRTESSGNYRVSIASSGFSKQIYVLSDTSRSGIFLSLTSDKGFFSGGEQISFNFRSRYPDGRPVSFSPVTVLVTDIKGNVISSLERQTDLEGLYRFKITPAENCKSDLLIKASLSCKGLHDGIEKRVLFSKTDIIANILPCSFPVVANVPNRFTALLTDTSMNPLPFFKFRIACKNSSVELRTDSSGMAFFDLTPLDDGKGIFPLDFFAKSQSGKDIMRKFKFTLVTGENGYAAVSSDRFAVAGGESVPLTIFSDSHPDKAVLCFREGKRTVDFYHVKLNGNHADLKIKIPDGSCGFCSVELLSEGITSGKCFFVVMPPKSGIAVSGLKKSYLPGERLEFDILPSGRQKYLTGIFSIAPVTGIFSFLNFVDVGAIDGPLLNLKTLLAFGRINGIQSEQYSRIFAYPGSIDFEQVTLPYCSDRFFSSLYEIGFCLNGKEKIDVSGLLPFDYFKGYLSFYDENGFPALPLSEIEVRNDFSLSMPILENKTFFVGDAIKLPVKVVNYTSGQKNAAMMISQRDAFNVVGSYDKKIVVKPYEEGYAYYDIIFNRAQEQLKLALGIDFENSYKELRGDISVKEPAYYENICQSFILRGKENVEINFPRDSLASGRNSFFEFYNCADALAENTFLKHNDKYCFNCFHILGLAMLNSDFGLDGEVPSFDSWERNEGGFSVYEFEEKADPLLTSLALRAIAKSGKNQLPARHVKWLENAAKTGETAESLLIYYNLRMAGVKTPADFKFEKTGEPLYDALGFYLTDSFSKSNADSIFSAVSTVRGKKFFHAKRAVFSAFDSSLSDIELTALIVLAVPGKYISGELCQGMADFLIESRLPDGTWGNPVTSWMAISALKKLVKAPMDNISVSVSSGDFKETVNFFNEPSVKIVKLPGIVNAQLAGDENYPVFCFLNSSFCRENFSPGKKMVTMNFSKNSVACSEKFICNLKWDFVDGRARTVLTFNVPWGTRVLQRDLEILKENGRILDFRRRGPLIYFLAASGGSMEIPLSAIFPAKVSVAPVLIEGVNNSRINGTGQIKTLEIKELKN